MKEVNIFLGKRGKEYFVYLPNFIEIFLQDGGCLKNYTVYDIK